MNNPTYNPTLNGEQSFIQFVYSKVLNRISGTRGFTLIEVFIVMGIIGTLAGISIPTYLKYKYEAEIVVAITDIRMIERQVTFFVFDNDGQLPDSLSDLPNINSGIKDPWGNSYRYLRIDVGNNKIPVSNPNAPVPTQKAPVPGSQTTGLARKNMMDAPVNQDFDLYSVGKDGKTNVSFKVPVSRDDVVRAYEGRYVGLVSEL